jgi:hypothetical protein
MPTNHLLMIRPINFSFNAETAVNNAFQTQGFADGAQEKAAFEFDAFVDTLRSAGVDVTVVNDTPVPYTPDSIFPNNWISFHSDGTIVLYPMFAENRRLERKQTVLDTIKEKFQVKETIDLSIFEKDNLFLEGTGSMVLDRENKLAYACLSPRTDKKVLEKFCEIAGYQPIVFNAMDENNQPIYHTNVLMCVADKYVVICMDAIKSPTEKDLVKNTIIGSGKIIVPISFDQMNHFAGNMLQVQNNLGENLLVMSSKAYQSLNETQKALLLQFNAILYSSINTIEINGGGSARCMMAEVYLKLVD